MSTDDSENMFYNEFDAFVESFPSKDESVVLCDTSARVGSNNDAWPHCLEHFGLGKCNDNGQQLLSRTLLLS